MIGSTFCTVMWVAIGTDQAAVDYAIAALAVFEFEAAFASHALNL